jgi:hypothetical protein
MESERHGDGRACPLHAGVNIPLRARKLAAIGLQLQAIWAAVVNHQQIGGASNNALTSEDRRLGLAAPATV